MARLFISLYLFITLALVSLSAGLDSIFEDAKHPKNNFNPSILRLFESAKQQQLDLKQFAEDSGLNNKLLSKQDIALPSALQAKLDSGKAILLYDDVWGEQVYISLDDGKILELSLAQKPPTSFPFIIYSGLFFVLLAALIALWLWPLWRDLRTLQNSVAQVEANGGLLPNKVSKTSLVAPIAQALNSMSQEVIRLMQNQRELTGAVAHEFRTPLARLKFALAVKPQPGTASWQAMADDVNELEVLVQEMLDFSSAHAHMPDINLSEIPLKSLCDLVIKRLPNANDNRIRISLKGSEEIILGDSHFIERALENLLINAQRYAKQEIQVAVTARDEYVELSVDDDGIGVDETNSEKIFEPFYRPDEARDRKRGGAGLGLAIVKRIMQWHQGLCWVKRSSLGGAKFTLRFNRIPA